MSTLETIQLLLGFGMFVIALIKLVVDLVKNDKKNNRLALASERLFFNELLATVLNGST